MPQDANRNMRVGGLCRDLMMSISSFTKASLAGRLAHESGVTLVEAGQVVDDVMGHFKGSIRINPATGEWSIIVDRSPTIDDTMLHLKELSEVGR